MSDFIEGKTKKVNLVLFAFLLLLGFFLFFYFSSHTRVYLIDDAGITYAFSKNIIDSFSFRASPAGEVVEGYSNLTWTLLLAFLGWMGFSIAFMAKFLGTLLGGATLFLCSLLLQEIQDKKWNDWNVLSLLPFFLLSILPEFMYWVAAGLENSLYSFFLCATLLCFLREQKKEGFPWSAILSFLLCITRPEGVLFAFVVFFFYSWNAFRTKKSKLWLQWGLFFGIPFVAYHAWHFWYFADFRPNTYWAKSPLVGKERLEKGLGYLNKSFTKGHLFVLLPLFFLGWLGQWKKKLPLLAFLGGALFFILYSGGDWVVCFRFGSFHLPIFSVLVSVGIIRIFGIIDFEKNRFPQRISKLEWVFLVGCVFVLLWGKPQYKRMKQIKKDNFCHFCNVSRDAKNIRTLAEKLQIPWTTLLTHDFGGPAWQATKSFQPIDYLGLCDARVAKILHAEFKNKHFYRRGLLDTFFQERGSFPTFVYFPFHWGQHLFWSHYVSSSYYDLPLYYIAKTQIRHDAKFKMFKGTLLNYFPPFLRWTPTTLDENLRLLAFSIEKEANKMLFQMAIVPTRKAPFHRFSWKIRLRKGQKHWSSSELFFLRNFVPALQQWNSGEPRVETVALPAGWNAENITHAEIGIQQNRRWKWVKLNLAQKQITLSSKEKVYSFPNGKAQPQNKEFLKLTQELEKLWELRTSQKDLTLRNHRLARQLLSLAQDLEKKKTSPELLWKIYSSVLQADNSLTPRVHKKIHQHRPYGAKEHRHFAWEIELLQKYYTTLEPLWLHLLIRYYAKQRKEKETKFFLQKANNPSKQSLSALLQIILSESQPRTPVDFQFLTPNLSAGWKASGRAFSRKLYTFRKDKQFIFNATHPYFINSFSPHGDSSQGQLTSPIFVVSAPVLSFWIGGGRRGVRLELWIEGKKINEASGRDSEMMFPVFWNLSAFAGKKAQLKMIDSSRRAWGHILIDHIQMWGSLSKKP